MRVDDIDYIRNLELFRQMSAESFPALMQAALLQRVPAGVTLFQEGERPEFLHVIVEGLVELFASHDAREATMELIRPPRAFILAAVLKGQAYLQSARTLERSRVLVIPAEDVRTAVGIDAGFARAVADDIAMRYRHIINELKNQKLRSGLERLADWLLTAQACQGGDTVRLGYEKRVLASLLGMSPENLSRAFAALARYGVEVKGREVRLNSPADLARLAKRSS